MKSSVRFGLCLAGFGLLSACNAPLDEAKIAAEPTILTYSEPGLSGLRAKRPYPNPDDVCELLSPNRYTDPVRQEGKDLIACPKHERGAIADRRAEGAKIVAHAKHWTILTVPLVSQ